MIKFIAVGLAAMVAAQEPPRQFDLVCEGTRQMALDGPLEAHSYGFRIDLDANRWCWRHCERTFEIVDVGPERLVLTEERHDTARRRSTSTNEISRVDGSHKMTSIEVRPYPGFYEIEGKCARAPFSGFPAAMF